jgi:gamma-D-glutamyl-L-lysine dipeptidyl-peptidase
MFGICHLSIVPVRSTPSDTAEMVTQLLLGETFEILESKGGWELIQIAFDNYEGWIDSKQYIPLQAEEFEAILGSAQVVSIEPIYQSCQSNGEILLVPFGSTLPDFGGATFSIGNRSFSFTGKTRLVSQKSDFPEIIKTSHLFLNAPYLWGGRSPMGIDCSGFVQLVFKVNGINLPRDASQQSLLGETIDFVSEVKPGDLAFFDNSDGIIVHVGILLASDIIIHASGQVRKDAFDHNGIFNSTLGRYSHKLRLIKRLIH